MARRDWETGKPGTREMEGLSDGVREREKVSLTAEKVVTLKPEAAAGELSEAKPETFQKPFTISSAPRPV